MNAPNAQKFIVSFLILSALTSSSVLFLSQTPAGTVGQDAENRAATASLDGKNVFVERVPVLNSYASPLAARSDIKYGSGANFTDQFADRLAAGILASNPKGPLIRGGVPTLGAPEDLASIADISGILPGSFSPAIDGKKISLLKEYTTEDVLNYLESSRSALQDTLAPGLAGLIRASLNADSIPSIYAVYDQTESKIYGSKVPAPFKGFNSALLSFVSSQRVFFDQDDPVKALVAMQNPELALGKFQKDLENEVKNLKANLPQILAGAKDNRPDKTYAALNAILGIEKAHALLPDIIGGISQILSTIVDYITTAWDYVMNLLANMEWLRKLLTEVVKDQIIKKLMAQIINWVNGGGEPQFVSNWQGFLGDAAKTAASGVLSKYAPQLCNNFGPLVQLNLSVPNQNVDQGSTGNPYQCTLDKVVSNIDQFRDSFENGGWLAYGELLQPQNNIFGSQILLGDAMMEESAKAKEAANSEASSGAGFKSQKECVNPVTYDEPAQIGGISSEADARSAFGSDFISATCPGGGRPCTSVTACSSDASAKSNTTPGGLVADTTNQISSSPTDRIVNAQDLTGLAVAIINSALNKLMTSSKKGLTNLSMEELNKETDPATSCAGLTGKDLEACEKMNSDIKGSEESAGNGKDGAIVQLKKLFQMKQKVLDEGSRAVAKAQETLGYLNVASSTCGAQLLVSTAPDAQDTLIFIEQNIGDLTDRVEEINDLIKDIAGDPNAPPDSDAFKGKLKRLNEVIELAQNDEIQTLARMFNISLLDVTDETRKKDDFYSKFSNDINNPGSGFGRIFGSLESTGNELGDVKTFATTLSVDGGCGILEKARLLYQPAEDTPACSIKAAEKTCRSGNY
jgi:hypothetical protein